jgi:hypothetical protein
MKTTFAFFVLLLTASAAGAQITNTFPTGGFAGIGTQLSLPAGPIDPLQIHYDPVKHPYPPVLRLSQGSGTNSIDFGILGLMLPMDLTYSSLVDSSRDLILHEHYDGDIIITNFTGVARPYGGAIRLATTGDTNLRPLIERTHHDLERMTILGNGNVGIDLPPDHTTGLCLPVEQLQVGGGFLTPSGYPSAVPGLSIYGGNRFEGMIRPDTAATFPIQWRNISFNDYQDHVHGGSLRVAPMSSSGIAFSESQGGLLQFNCWPFDSLRGLNDKTHNVTLQMTGNDGLSMWCWRNDSDQYHHLFDVLLPDVTGWPISRNTNGLFVHHTPVLITSDTTSTASIDFTNLLHVNPLYGDGQTWLLAVNGPAIFKEAFVSLDWPDYVFDCDYKLMPLNEVEKYITGNHHLPGVPSADSLAKTGVPLGQTEAKLMEKIEELTKYLIEQNKEIEQLKSEVQELQEAREE